MEEQLNKPETQTNAQTEERVKEQPDEQTNSRMTELKLPYTFRGISRPSDIVRPF